MPINSKKDYQDRSLSNHLTNPNSHFIVLSYDKHRKKGHLIRFYFAK